MVHRGVAIGVEGKRGRWEAWLAVEPMYPSGTLREPGKVPSHSIHEVGREAWKPPTELPFLGPCR